MAAGDELPQGEGLSRERLQVETSEKGLLAISALVLAVLFALPAVGALQTLAEGRFGILEMLYPTVLVLALAGAIYFGRAYRTLKRRL